MSPARAGAFSPHSTRSAENISPIRFESADNSYAHDANEPGMS